VARTQILYELLEFADLVLEHRDSVLVGLKPTAVRVDLVQGGFVLYPADVQDFAR